MTSGQTGFLYTGERDVKIPGDVTHIKVDATVTEIPDAAFIKLRKLVAAELSSDQLETIGSEAFWDNTKLRTVTLPSTLKIIGKWAFGNCSKLHSPELPEGLESIGEGAYCGCNFRNVRIPPSITELRNGSFEYCLKLLSLELPEKIKAIHDYAFHGCERLRNLALPLSLVRFKSDKIFHGCQDLRQVFPDVDDLANALKHRFDGLPLHDLCYYQSYHPTATMLECLAKATLASYTTSERRQDCLGMTPLHILILSSKPNVKIIRVLLQYCPDDLIAKDKWGYLPFYYACECDAPLEIIQLFVEIHTAIFPDEELDWTKMVKTSRLDLAQLLLASNLVFANLPSRITHKKQVIQQGQSS